MKMLMQLKLNMPARVLVLVGVVDHTCVEDKAVSGLHLHMGCGEPLSSRMLSDVAPVAQMHEASRDRQ